MLFVIIALSGLLGGLFVAYWLAKNRAKQIYPVYDDNTGHSLADLLKEFFHNIFIKTKVLIFKLSILVLILLIIMLC